MKGDANMLQGNDGNKNRAVESALDFAILYFPYHFSPIIQPVFHALG